ncbi:MAG: cystathionine beta-lyase/cystathionine gamma-synthase [Sphingobacteriales bacterium]|jgi:cystathionine beta-lyase/cystathionine gamma-synthase
MGEKSMLNYIKAVLENMPTDWLNLTTHRLDIYDEKQAKTQFLKEFEILYKSNNFSAKALQDLPTAFDYIRLGHPLSCILEWVISGENNQKPENIISFSSRTIPIMAILRKNLLENKGTRILYSEALPEFFDAELIHKVYGYKFEMKKVADNDEISEFNGSTVFFSQQDDICNLKTYANIDFFINAHPQLGSVLFVNGEKNESYISDIQHVRRRETISMTPVNCHAALKSWVDNAPFNKKEINVQANKTLAQDAIKKITESPSRPLIASSGLSMQYAIMMGMIHDALEKHKGKAIKFIVPPNCYGGTNDQARRVVACLENAEVVDLLVDGGNDMVNSIDNVLDQIALENALPFIIAEIPTNPRVEVPNLDHLKEVLSKKRKTASGEIAIDPVFILDQTFCPNVHFLGEGAILSTVRTISYVSGSKFPSGGKCTAGYCVGNSKTEGLMEKIELHLGLCDNAATNLQMEILSVQLPSMTQRIHDAYKNTREFVNFIEEVLPAAKINFVSEELAEQGFTPSVFSLDLPTKGNTKEEKDAYKNELNLKLINLMISKIPEESKFCVSYGQLKGSYWTIPATSTQGTTKEGDKDYIIRTSLSPTLDLDLHKKVFLDFVGQI